MRTPLLITDEEHEQLEHQAQVELYTHAILETLTKDSITSADWDLLAKQRTMYGIDETEHGPFSVPSEDFSPFNVGLQLDLIVPALVKFLTTGMGSSGCTGIAALKNGIQIFAGSVPLYKGGRLVGAIGVSGDGIDQDDLVSAMGSTGFESPPEIRCDTVIFRDTRLPFVKFPRNPNRQ